jgi:hypothetical protein
VDVLNDPNKVLQLVAAGQLMPEHIEALRTIFPRLHQAQIEAVLNGLIEKGLPLKLDQAQLQSLGRFLGTATSRMFSTKFIQDTQNKYVAARQQQLQKGKKGEINLPSFETESQRVLSL